MDPDIRPSLSDEAVHYAFGSYSGPTDPKHLNGTYGGVSHPKYNAFVKEELEKYIELKKFSKQTKMSATDMEQFVDLIMSGKGASGEATAKSRLSIGPCKARFGLALQCRIRWKTSLPRARST